MARGIGTQQTLHMHAMTAPLSPVLRTAHARAITAMCCKQHRKHTC